MKKILLLLIFIFSFNFLFAQSNRANMWYFGVNAGIDFNGTVPVAVSNSAMTQHEGCSSISDDIGNLLFYTDGVNVYNSSHALMPNGTGLLGHFTCTQSALIVPKPGSTTLYYIFTMAGYSLSHGFCYSIVDMTLDGGNGDVIAKNTTVLDSIPLTEKLAATLHANGQDVWVAVHENYTDAFYAYPVTASGIGTPVVSNAGTMHTGLFPFIGYMKFSPMGNKVAVALNGTPQMDLIDFDKATGVFSNAATFTGPGAYTYGVEFSRLSTKLYASHGSNSDGDIYQFDMTLGSNSAIVASGLPVYNYGNYPAALQSAPDGKIYFCQYYTEWIGRINSPELAGMACNAVTNALNLGAGNLCRMGLPNMISNYLSDIETSGVADNNPVDPIAEIYPNPFYDAVTVMVPVTTHGSSRFTIRDCTGRIVFDATQTFNGREYMKTIPLEFLTEGIYLFEIDHAGKRSVMKLVKV